jgi:HAD superfamily phosphatase (TIGR01668 family)
MRAMTMTPDLYYSSIATVDLTELASRGITSLLVDLDNTLLPRGTAQLPPEALAFAGHLRDAGMRACLVSNNWHRRVHAAACELGFDLVPRAGKPLPFAFLVGLRRLDSARSQTAVVGDQVFTDILGGNALGMLTVLVRPLSSTDLPHTLLLRRLEARILGDRMPLV